MRMLQRFSLFFLVVFSVNVFSQDVFEFLRIQESPRTAALAGSFVAGNDDPNVIFNNPAGLKSIKESPVSFSFLKHLMDINSATLAASHEFEDWGRFGGAIKYINYGSFIGADINGVKTGEFSAAEFAMILGYANLLGDNFYYGANLKFIYSGLESYSSTGMAADFGLHYEIPESQWNFGFSILNVGSQLTKYINTSETLPVDVRVGLTKKMEHIPFKFYLSFNRLNEKQDKLFEHFKNFTFGGEITFSDKFTGRFGYDGQLRKELKIGSSSGLGGVSVGFGLNVKGYVVDYAFSSLGSIGALHRFGLSTTF